MAKVFRNPCERECECEWCSMICFLKRGYIWDKKEHSWVYDSNGQALRSKTRECNWEPGNRTPKELADLEEQLK